VLLCQHLQGIFYFVTWDEEPSVVTSFLLLFLGEFVPLALVMVVFRTPPPQSVRSTSKDPENAPDATTERLIPAHEAGNAYGSDEPAPPLGISYTDA